jgi:hypothetical protein
MTDGKNLVVAPQLTGNDLVAAPEAVTTGASNLPNFTDMELSEILAHLTANPVKNKAVTESNGMKASLVSHDVLNEITTGKLIDNLENYLGLHTVQQILRGLNLISARSWSELKALVKSGIANNPELKSRILDALVMQQACDLKAVSYYPVQQGQADQIASTIASLEIPTSSVALSYPLRVDAEALAEDNGELKPVKIFEDEFGCGVILGRKRVFTISEDISSANFNDALREQFPDAEKIVAVKSITRQTFDTLYINRISGLLEMRADIMRDATVMQTAGQTIKSTSDLKGYANRLLSKHLQGLVLGEPINMFPLATKVYADKSGAIKRLGFVTETDSVKKETMKAGIDLREELFHKNGALAIDHKMAIFEIAIQWHGDDVIGGIKGSKPEIHIPGTYRDYMNPNSRTDHVIVKGVRTFADANFIVSKINSYRT